ncbi:hypothetical protein STEG23_009708 [Scotinomys teguina]
MVPVQLVTQDLDESEHRRNRDLYMIFQCKYSDASEDRGFYEIPFEIRLQKKPTTPNTMSYYGGYYGGLGYGYGGFGGLGYGYGGYGCGCNSIRRLGYSCGYGGSSYGSGYGGYGYGSGYGGYGYGCCRPSCCGGYGFSSFY